MTDQSGTTAGVGPSVYALAMQILRDRECNAIAEARRRARKITALARERTRRLLWRPRLD